MLIVAIAASVVLAVVFGGSTPQETMDELAEQMSVDEVGVGSLVDLVGESAGSERSTTGIDKAPSPSDPSNAIHTENQNGAAQLWSAYDIAFEDNDPYSPLSQVHMQFKNQQRDESWAMATEAGIRGSIDLVEAARIGVTVEHVECRSTICEVAGYMPEIMTRSPPDPRDIFVDDFGVGWWPGDFNTAVRQHNYEEEEFQRFLVIIANAGVIEEWTMPDQQR